VKRTIDRAARVQPWDDSAAVAIIHTGTGVETTQIMTTRITTNGFRRMACRGEGQWTNHQYLPSFKPTGGCDGAASLESSGFHIRSRFANRQSHRPRARLVLRRQRHNLIIPQCLEASCCPDASSNGLIVEHQ
jgi:hypothetical protein